MTANPPSIQDDFGLRLSAHMSGETPAAYLNRQQYLLDHLDDLEQPSAPTCEEEYRHLHAIKSQLASLYCHTFNTEHPAFDRVCRLEDEYGKLLAAYNRRLLVKSRSHVLVARYLLWSRRFAVISKNAAFLVAREFDLLRKVRQDASAPWRLVVIGLSRAVGDNVFTVDRHGRQHRQHRRTIGRQAFAIEQSHAFTPQQWDEFLDGIPELDPTYREVYVGDRKHAVRGSAFTREAKREVFDILNSSWADQLKTAATPALSVQAHNRAVSSAAPRVEQLALGLAC